MLIILRLAILVLSLIILTSQRYIHSSWNSISPNSPRFIFDQLFQISISLPSSHFSVSGTFLIRVRVFFQQILRDTKRIGENDVISLKSIRMKRSDGTCDLTSPTFPPVRTQPWGPPKFELNRTFDLFRRRHRLTREIIRVK